jgi:hypothetical protein
MGVGVLLIRIKQLAGGDKGDTVRRYRPVAYFSQRVSFLSPCSFIAIVNRIHLAAGIGRVRLADASGG